MSWFSLWAQCVKTTSESDFNRNDVWNQRLKPWIDSTSRVCASFKQRKGGTYSHQCCFWDENNYKMSEKQCWACACSDKPVQEQHNWMRLSATLSRHWQTGFSVLSWVGSAHILQEPPDLLMTSGPHDGKYKPTWTLYEYLEALVFQQTWQKQRFCGEKDIRRVHNICKSSGFYKKEHWSKASTRTGVNTHLTQRLREVKGHRCIYGLKMSHDASIRQEESDGVFYWDGTRNTFCKSYFHRNFSSWAKL